jgi:hypothetical protein
MSTSFVNAVQGVRREGDLFFLTLGQMEPNTDGQLVFTSLNKIVLSVDDAVGIFSFLNDKLDNKINPSTEPPNLIKEGKEPTKIKRKLKKKLTSIQVD